MNKIKIEVDKEEAEEIIAKGRHKESVELSKTIIGLLTDNNISQVVKAIENQSVVIYKFVHSINNLPKPEVNIEVNQDEIKQSISELGKLILKGQTEIFEQLRILNMPKETYFSFRRDNGLIESPIKVTTKFIQPKAQA